MKLVTIAIDELLIGQFKQSPNCTRAKSDPVSRGPFFTSMNKKARFHVRGRFIVLIVQCIGSHARRLSEVSCSKRRFTSLHKKLSEVSCSKGVGWNVQKFE